MRIRILAGAAALAMAAVPALAKTPSKTGADAAAAQAASPRDEPATATRPFVESSMVLAPKQVGPWALVSANDYPGDPGSGAGFRYEHRDHPDVRVDLFVYVVGRLVGDDVDQALDAQIATVRRHIEQGVQTGHYDSATFDAAVPAWLPPPPGAAPADVAPAAGATADVAADAGHDDRSAAAGPAATPDAPEDADTKALETALLDILARDEARDRRIPGRKLSLEMGWNLTPVSSRGYVFYRGLYFYKGRVSASHATMPTAQLDAFADAAMTALVPMFRVDSTGGCYINTVVVDPTAGKVEGPSQLFAGLLASEARAEAEACAATLDDDVPEGYHGIRIDYPADAWR